MLHIDGNIIRQLPPQLGACHALVELVGSNNLIEEVRILNFMCENYGVRVFICVYKTVRSICMCVYVYVCIQYQNKTYSSTATGVYFVDLLTYICVCVCVCVCVCMIGTHACGHVVCSARMLVVTWCVFLSGLQGL